MAPPASASGMSCSIGEVVVENLKIGHHYSLKALVNLPLLISNNSEQPMRVSVDALVPDVSELRRGAEAIPNIHWASAMPDTIEIPSHSQSATDLRLDIPDRADLLGRRFQVVFWSHNLPQPGQMLAYGLKSRVIFSIDPVRDTSVIEPSGEMSVTLMPDVVQFAALVPGHEYRLDQLIGEPIRVRNTSTRPISVELRVLGAGAMAAPAGTAYGDLLKSGTVKLSEPRLMLAPGEERVLSGTVTLAKRGSIKGKNLMCVIAAAVADQSVRTEVYSRLYARAR